MRSGWPIGSLPEAGEASIIRRYRRIGGNRNRSTKEWKACVIRHIVIEMFRSLKSAKA